VVPAINGLPEHGHCYAHRHLRENCLRSLLDMQVQTELKIFYISLKDSKLEVLATINIGSCDLSFYRTHELFN
jgi:hypothetical protein